MPDLCNLDDAQRLDALDRYDILDTREEEAFDRITRLVRRFFGVDFATVTFIDGHRQWFKSRQGLANSEEARHAAFCQIPIFEGRPLVVPDTFLDPRFVENPLVLGPPHLRFYAGVPLRGSGKIHIGTLCAMHSAPRQFDDGELSVLIDLARMVEVGLHLRLVAMRDELTGVLSRRAFREEAERAVALATRHKHELSCITFDLDHFKKINDKHGHAMGDAVLIKTIETCRTLLRKSDVVGRLGGEEFAILLPHTNLSAAYRVADKIRAAIAQQNEGTNEDLVGVTSSFGVASLERAAIDLDMLLDHADKALYSAKESGRNRCNAWHTAGSELVGRRVLKSGQIAFNSGRSVIDCTVRRLSDKGAWIGIVSSADVPQKFKLRIEADDFSRACEVVQRADTQLEIVFC